MEIENTKTITKSNRVFPKDTSNIYISDPKYVFLLLTSDDFQVSSSTSCGL